MRASRGSRGTRFHKSTYELEARIDGRNRIVWYRVGAVVLLMLVLAGSGYAAFRGLLAARDALFVRNERFAIRRIDVQDGQIKTADMIREYFAYEGVTIGSNLFGFDVDAFRNLYLERNPLVKWIEIQRVLPDTLKVSIVEREPLARLGQRESLVSDREGVVFRLSSGLHKLPVVIGDKDPTLQPGMHVRGLTRAAVDVLAMCDNPRLGLLVLGVDIRKKDYLILHVVSTSGIKETKLWWEGMDEPMNDASREILLHRLLRLRQAAQLSGDYSKLDATFPGKVFAQ